MSDGMALVIFRRKQVPFHAMPNHEASHGVFVVRCHAVLVHSGERMSTRRV